MLFERLTVLCSMLFLLGTSAAHAQFVKAKGTEIVDASGKPLLIRGISSGNWMVLEGYFWHLALSIRTRETSRLSSRIYLDPHALRNFSTSGARIL